MKVLFVDDEPRVLSGIERSLHVAHVAWTASFVTSGPGALEQLATDEYDILVSDVRMPGAVDGPALLQIARERYPSIVRIVLSGQVDEQSSMRLTRLAHQFLAKPCTVPTLRAVLDRAFDSRQVLAEPRLFALVAGLSSVPSAPGIWTTLAQALEQDDGAIGHVIELIRQDPGLAAKVLQLVNSSFFGHSREIYDIKTAVVRLGLKTLRGLVSELAVASDEPPVGAGGPLADVLQRRAFEIARIARALVDDPTEAQTAFTAGLLCGVGGLVGQEPAWAPVLAERQAQIGACLLGLWGLPQCIVNAVLHQHAPEPGLAASTTSLTLAVWAASCIAGGVAPNPGLVDALGAGALLDRARHAQSSFDATLTS